MLCIPSMMMHELPYNNCSILHILILMVSERRGAAENVRIVGLETEC
jgi:hypothetical protein